METSLYRKRCEDFRSGKLEFVVTKCEYSKFVCFCNELWHLSDEDVNRYGLCFPDPLRYGHVCVFYRDMTGALAWYCPLGNDIKNRERIPFALMHEEPDTKAATPPLYASMNPVGASAIPEHLKAEVVEGKWDDARDWGAEKIEIRNRFRTIARLMAEITEREAHIMTELNNLADIIGFK